ncbi:MAG TPA: hypothetical protein VM182_00890 [Terriglobia bacterium]|nr:hypothetical protein [Terriglobia bacterium]
MKNLRRLAIVLGVGFGLTSPAWAQRMMQPPRITGEFKPVVGAGAQYEVTAEGKKTNWAYAVVGKESVEGADGYWTEMRLEADSKNGKMIMKHLMVMSGGAPEIKRMIMQAPGQPPMEMPMGMMGGMMKRAREASGEETALGEKLGTESVTVPAGTFVCDHYRATKGKSATDVWISAKVSPWGMVKMTSKDMTMELTKVLENQTSEIKGEPQKMEMPQF